MSDASDLLHRIRYTPLRDLLRARFTGRLDWKSRVNGPDLPVPAAKLIVRVVKRTRLWSLEKVQVANELIAHFSDGVASGATIDELINRFGDERQAARLIARAKRRNRPIAWHALRALTFIAATLILVYAGLTVRFFLGRPSPKVDYLAIADASTIATPSNQRAWPVYRAALATIFPKGKADVDVHARFVNAETKTQNWKDALVWVRAHRDAIAEFHRAARLPILGYAFEPNSNPANPRPIHWIERSVPPDDTSLTNVNLPSADLHLVSMLLVLEGWDRIELNDPLSVQNVESLLYMANQNQGQAFGGWDNSAFFRSEALSLVEFALTKHRQLWSDAQLAALAHELARPRVAGDIIDLRAQRIFFYDVVQRTYTDDGDGDGRITSRFDFYLNTRSIPWPDSQQVFTAGATAVIASRREVLREWDDIMDQFQAELQRNARDVGPGSLTERIIRLKQSPLTCWRYLPIAVLAPRPDVIHWFAERYLARRDAIEVAIALELYRRQHQSYPQQLAELVPNYLPAVPVDPIVGDPLHYRVANGQPLIYSVGFDRDDDLGRIMRRTSGAPLLWPVTSRQVPDFTSTADAPDGDWVLYPQPDPRD